MSRVRLGLVLFVDVSGLHVNMCITRVDPNGPEHTLYEVCSVHERRRTVNQLELCSDEGTEAETVSAIKNNNN